MNVATYGPKGRFTMTDRGRSALRQSAQRIQIGPSSMGWNGNQLVIEVNEVTAPPQLSRVRGMIRVTPSAITDQELPLTQDGAHVWRPFAPVSRIEVDMEAQGWQWQGHGYFDANFGTRALEDDFAYWTWGRYPTRAGATCFYDAQRQDGTHLAQAATFDEGGNVHNTELPETRPMQRSLWQVKRATRGDEGAEPTQVMNMLDAPFYSRSMVKTELQGEPAVGVHEALDLTRFAKPWLKPMIAVRVPRRTRWRFDD
ncbi:carotenoid 1,2-hydratase [Roseivivax lentus]|uniref:Carotenoid 1,2-hydratase n=2 Tax=Roseivivax lentus TaxID=633194 RepID=A0A1N7JNI9_9RHOB|nr:carotenoid 1,2-hydratase [Roseivivax lentus]